MTNLPEGWEIRRLEDLCEPGKQAIVDGPFGSNLKRSDYVDNGIPVLKIQNIKENLITLKKMDYVSPDKYQELVRHSFTEGDIVMTKLGDPLGVSAIVNGIPNGLIVADLVRIRPSKVLTKFLCYQLNSPRIQKYINEQQKGTTRPRVNLAMIRELPIYTPPIEEQHKIVDFLEDHLSRLDAALVDVKQAKIMAAQFRISVLHSFFNSTTNTKDWKSTTLEKIGRWKTGSTPISKNPEFQGSDVKFVTPGDIDYGGKLNAVARTISNKGADSVRRISPPSVHLVCIGTIGKVAWTNEIVTTNQQINSLEVDTSENNPEFLMWLLASPGIQEKLWGNSSSTTVPILNKGNLEKIECSLPPLEIQNEVMKSIDISFSKLDAVLETANLLENQSSILRRSLLQAAFTGQLTKEVVSV